MTTARLIKLTYSTLDHFRETRTFKTLAGARAYAAKRLGTHYDLGFSYAVDMYGTGKLEIRTGTTFAELLDIETETDNDLGATARDAAWDGGHNDDDLEF